MPVICLFMVLLIAVGPVAAQQRVDIQPYVELSAREDLERFTNDLSSLHAQFTQRIISTDGYVEDESVGEVWLKKHLDGQDDASPSGHFRWAYYGEFPELIVADGERVWIYDEALAQVTVRLQSQAAADNPLALLTDVSLMDEQFVVRELGDIDGMRLLELRSRNEESQFERVLLGLTNGSLDMLAMEDAFGLRTEVRFSDVTRNLQLADELFRFTPPEGADVIGNVPDDSTPLGVTSGDHGLLMQ